MKVLTVFNGGQLDMYTLNIHDIRSFKTSNTLLLYHYMKCICIEALPLSSGPQRLNGFFSYLIFFFFLKPGYLYSLAEACSEQTIIFTAPLPCSY